MSFRRIFMSVVCVSIAVTVCSGCTSSTVPAEWQDAYQSLNLEALNARDHLVVDCLDEHGFPGFTVVWNGGIESPPLPVSQRDVVRETMAQCQDQLGGSGAQATSEKEITARYQLEVAATECLSNHGFSSADKPPSLQQYIDAFDTDEHWSAYGAIADQLKGESDLRKVGADCPDPGWFAGLLPATEDH